MGDDAIVIKSYEGPDSEERLTREHHVLSSVAELLPVPKVVNLTGHALTTSFMAGAHGQDLLDSGHAEQVLQACGEILGHIHALDVGKIFPGGEGVVVHGDFGPNNMLIDPATWQVTAVLDWEWAKPGAPVEDLAWCEWIMRMHHGEHIALLDCFFDAYPRPIPAWPERQQVMIARCHTLREFCRRWNPDSPAVAHWAERTAITASWMP